MQLDLCLLNGYHKLLAIFFPDLSKLLSLYDKENISTWLTEVIIKYRPPQLEHGP